jgi:hypothetical protein
MPAGDLLAGINYRCELRGVLFGALSGTVPCRRLHIDGLGTPKPKTNDHSLQLRPGSVGAPEHPDVRVLIVEFDIVAATDEQAYLALIASNAAWASVTDNVDLELHLQWPGFGHVYILGRPRGLEETADFDRVGADRAENVIPCMGEFHALDPTIYPVAS